MLLERPTEEEVTLAGYLHDPVCVTENLFVEDVKQLDSLQYFDEDNNFKVRLYQLPFLSYDYLIADDPKISKQSNFKLKKGSGSGYIYCGRGIGKCEWIENKILLASGKEIKIKKLIGKTREVLSLNENNYKIEKDTASFFDNGNRSCYKIITVSGKEITVTSNHPLLTEKGWIEAQKLSQYKFIAVPRSISINGSKKVLEEEAILLGYLIGDGSCSQGTIGFTNINKELIDEIYYLADFFDCELRHRKQSYFFKNKNFKPNKTNNVKKLVKKYKINCLSKNKVLPNRVFSWSNKYIALLLNRLFACDGHLNKNNQQFEISLASKELIYQIQSLLLRFGIKSSIYYKKATCNDKIFDAWRLYVISDLDILINKIGIKSKDQNYKKTNRQYNNDVIPCNLIQNLKKEFFKYKGLWYKYSLRKISTYNLSIKKLIKITKKIKNNNQINKYAYSDIYWDKIKSVTYVGELPTVGVSVTKNHNYISNNIISHNTLFQVIDLCLDTIHHCYDWTVAVSSFDDIHVANLLEPYITALKKHPFLKNFYSRAIRNPYKVETLPNRAVQGVNMTLSGREPGSQFESVHCVKMYIDEHQYETDQVVQKRSQSVSENGAIERFSGITNFTRQSPAGKIFFDINEKNWLVNLPKSVSPYWNTETKNEALNDYGDESAPAYKIHIEAEVVENAIGLYDIDLLRRCYMYNTKRPIKHFDINKDNYDFFRSRVVVEKLNYAKRVWVAADFGVTAPTEIIIIFELEDKETGLPYYKYIYNITLTGLIPDQQTEFFKWLMEILDIDYIAMDCTELGASQIIQDLGKFFPQDNLIKVRFNEKMLIGHEKDENGVIKLVEGKPVEITAYVIDWAVERTRDLFYKEKIDCLYDLKLDKQFSNMIAVRQATRLKYSSLLSNKEDHLHAAFLVFNIARFLKEENLDVKPKTLTWGIGSIGSI